MSFSKTHFTLAMTSVLLFSCAHTARDPSATRLAGLDTSAQQKKIDRVLETNGMLEKLSTPGNTELRGGANTEVLKDREYEGSLVEWRAFSADNKGAVTRVITTSKAQAVKRDEEGNYYTKISGDPKKPTLAQLHLSKTGEFVSLKKCSADNGQLNCVEINDDTCYSFFNSKNLTKVPAALNDWKVQACKMKAQIAEVVDDTFTEPSKWAVDALSQDKSVEGVGSNKNMFNDDLKSAFQTNMTAKDPVADHSSLISGVQSLDCDFEDVTSDKERDVVKDYTKKFQPVFLECLRTHATFPEFGKTQAVASETRTPKKAPVKKKRKPNPKRAHWVWEK